MMPPKPVAPLLSTTEILELQVYLTWRTCGITATPSGDWSTALADMTQERWDQYISSRDGIKLSTLKAHLRQFTSLLRHHGLALGAPLIPEFDHVAVPKSERAERQDTITEAQFEELVKALIALSLRTRKIGHRNGTSGLGRTRPRKAEDVMWTRRLRHQYLDWSIDSS